MLVPIYSLNSCSFKSSILSNELEKKEKDLKKQGTHPRKKSSFFTKVTECFSEYFDLISILAGALKSPRKSWKPGCRV